MDHRERYLAVTELFSALASPVRAAIVDRLDDGPATVSELCDALVLSQPLASQHLRVLREAGLVSAERVGRSTAYSLADEHVAHIFRDAYLHTQENHHEH